jgi:hypothetical protein
MLHGRFQTWISWVSEFEGVGTKQCLEGEHILYLRNSPSRWDGLHWAKYGVRGMAFIALFALLRLPIPRSAVGTQLSLQGEHAAYNCI